MNTDRATRQPLRVLHHVGMKTIYEIRRDNTRELCGPELGSHLKLANLLGMQKQLLSQYIGKTPGKGIGNKVARRIEQVYDKPEGWLDREHNDLEAGRQDDTSVDVAALQQLTDDSATPLQLPAGSIQIARLSKAWLSSKAISQADKLALLPMVGDAMAPTLADGAILLVDRGVRHVRADAVYTLARGGDVFVKRVMRRTDGALILISDNHAYPQQIVEDPASSGLVVLGRLVAAWNAAPV